LSSGRTQAQSFPNDGADVKSRQGDNDIQVEVLSANITSKSAKPKHSSKKFDKMFGKKSQKKEDGEDTKVVNTAPEGSVEYWNQIRESMGMKKLRE
jgi:hypothetical protein